MLCPAPVSIANGDPMTLSIAILALIGAISLLLAAAHGLDLILERLTRYLSARKRREPVRVVTWVPRAVAIPAAWRRTQTKGTN
jgi:hypothetical protein